MASINATAPGRLAPTGPMLWLQTTCEFLRLWRNPGFSLASLALPAIFFAFFGLPNLHHQTSGVRVGRYLLASFGSYGVISVMLYSFGLSIAVERGQRITVLMRATPLRPAVYLLARVVTAITFAFLMLVLLFAFGALAGGIRMEATTWATLTVRLLLGSLPFIGLGFAIGYLASPTAAPAITNLLFLILSFASGLFVPLAQLPRLVQQIAPYLPTYHLGQLAWNAIGARTDPLSTSVAWLAGYGLVFAVIALRSYWREEQRAFG